jgi:hypothetical protein
MPTYINQIDIPPAWRRPVFVHLLPLVWRQTALQAIHGGLSLNAISPTISRAIPTHEFAEGVNKIIVISTSARTTLQCSPVRVVVLPAWRLALAPAAREFVHPPHARVLTSPGDNRRLLSVMVATGL